MPAKANLKRQVRLRENKDIKFANRICKTLSKLFQIARKTYNTFKLTCVVSNSL